MNCLTIPKYVAGEAFHFQVRAKDRAGNYRVGYSKVIIFSGTKGGDSGLYETAIENDPESEPSIPP
ncbi:MAG: hypothetical protein GXY44_09725 [Phycisphaerales bacterium]|nr:hypothetical protein [Phycisphaerales bacterium]